MFGIDEESAFGEALLTVVSETPAAKQAISELAIKISDVVVLPILKKLNKGEALTVVEEGVVAQLADQHSSSGKQWGAVMPQYTKEEILSDVTKKRELMSQISDSLLPENIRKAEGTDAMMKHLKPLVDCCFCYVEKMPKESHGQHYESIKDSIFPTPQELAARISRKELGQVDHSSTSFGVGSQLGVDVSPTGDLSSESKHYSSGKAAFGDVSSQRRADLLSKQYASIKTKLDGSHRELAEVDRQIKLAGEEAIPGLSESKQKLILEVADLESKLDGLAKSMKQYRISLNSNEREVDLVVKQYDRAKNKLDSLNRDVRLMNEEITKANPHSIIDMLEIRTILLAQIAELQPTLDGLTTRMQQSEIPLNPKQRESKLSSAPPKSSIEKLAELGSHYSSERLPMLATASGTTARALIALHDINAFDDPNGNFDKQKAQYFGAALCGAFVHGGHHTVVEVGDVYNRLLDHVNIEQMEQEDLKYNQLKQRVLNQEPVSPVDMDFILQVEHKRNEHIGHVEEHNPHYVIGESYSIIPENMREGVRDQTNEILQDMHARKTSEFRETVRSMGSPQETTEEVKTIKPPGHGP